MPPRADGLDEAVTDDLKLGRPHALIGVKVLDDPLGQAVLEAKLESGGWLDDGLARLTGAETPKAIDGVEHGGHMIDERVQLSDSARFLAAGAAT